MMDTLRAFIAIEMPPPVVDIVRRTQQALQRGGVHMRWVKPENVHLTLRFLGDISTGDIDPIRCALEKLAAESPSATLRIEGAGVFPGPARPRVVWLGLGGQTHLLGELHQRLSLLLSRLGFPEEKRPFRGHLTLGRAKGRVDAHRLRVQLAELKAIESQCFPGDRICLFRSDLRPDGAVYTPLVKVRAGCGPSGDNGK
jgi:2'-5' RNA ligase